MHELLTETSLFTTFFSTVSIWGLSFILCYLLSVIILPLYIGLESEGEYSSTIIHENIIKFMIFHFAIIFTQELFLQLSNKFLIIKGLIQTQILSSTQH